MTATRTFRRALVVALAAMLLYAPVRVDAQALELDSFSEPAAPLTISATGVVNTPSAKTEMRMSAPSIGGGAREALLSYGDDLGGVASLHAGGGALVMEQPAGFTGYIALRYGAFMTSPEQAPLTLDLRGQESLSLRFARVDGPLSVGVTFATRSPLDPADPIFYSWSERSVEPASPGAPLEVALPLDHGARFNWAQVQGLYVWVYSGHTAVSGATRATYALDALGFKPAFAGCQNARDCIQGPLQGAESKPTLGGSIEPKDFDDPNVRTRGCTDNEDRLLWSAYVRLQKLRDEAIAQTRFTQCLDGAVLVETGRGLHLTSTPSLERCGEPRLDGAQLTRIFVENFYYQLRCDNLPPPKPGLRTNAEADIAIEGTIMTVNKAFLASSPGPQRVAAVMAHEVMHNRGFAHVVNDYGSPGYRLTVPEQVEACVENGAANGPLPDQLDRVIVCDECITGGDFITGLACFPQTLAPPVLPTEPVNGVNGCSACF